MEEPPKFRNSKFHSAILFIMAAIVLTAVWPANAWNYPDPGLYILNSFSHGTSLTNLLSAITYFIAGITTVSHKKTGNRFSYVRAAAVVYMISVLFLYPFFLQQRAYFHDGIFEWRDFVLHFVDPLFMIFWWFIFPSSRPISILRSYLILIPVAMYGLYIFIRGSFINWYPYTVIDPQKNSWNAIIKIVVVAAIAFVIIVQFVGWTTRLQKAHRSTF